MECKPFHRPHRFLKNKLEFLFMEICECGPNKQTKEIHENGRSEKREKNNEIEMETLRWNYTVTQECIAQSSRHQLIPIFFSQNPFASISHISNGIPAEWSMEQSNRNCLLFDFLFLF